MQGADSLPTRLVTVAAECANTEPDDSDYFEDADGDTAAADGRKRKKVRWCQICQMRRRLRPK